ncbi:hypothetical protein [Lacticaseibacillus thailandensis]|uniref:hypothetical protein n=1 Tax=Lacticaseibacillus thailandensis TaxID=381741 RepID=UPI0012E7F7B5|nr:hypothetical protein [Lacticaseibacillus thailandensis]
MNNIPTDMDQVASMVQAAAAAGHPTTATDVINKGLQQSAQDYMDEATEGSYFSAHLSGNQITIDDMNGKQVATIRTPAASYAEAFKANPRQTLTNIDNDLRHLIDTRQIAL